MKLWPLVNTLALGMFALGIAAGAQNHGTSAPTNELTLAGLRPGVSGLADAEKRFGADNRIPSQDDSSAIWYQPCFGRAVVVEFDDDKVIQSVTVTSLFPQSGDCTETPRNRLHLTKLGTGQGLVLGQHKQRVIGLYGEPDSAVPTTYEGRDLDLLYYAFDWAGSDVPQVMEVTCERGTGRVRKITLAFPSL